MILPARPEVGKERYLSHSKGIGGKLRKIPEDFNVEEIPAQDIDDVSVSSTKIRKSLHLGNFKTDNNYLGYKFML